LNRALVPALMRSSLPRGSDAIPPSQRRRFVEVAAAIENNVLTHARCGCWGATRDGQPRPRPSARDRRRPSRAPRLAEEPPAHHVRAGLRQILRRCCVRPPSGPARGLWQLIGQTSTAFDRECHNLFENAGDAAAIPVVGSRLQLILTVAGRLGTALGRGIESTDRHSRHRLRQAIAVFSRAHQGSRPHPLFQTAKSWGGDSDVAGDLVPSRIMPVSFVSSMGSAFRAIGPQPRGPRF
jgi:hypothetical protein